ncbi:MAG TPA: efflux RND transporter periplasmic adaptor subunit [Gemmatimonadaceae bacterium]|nr:efflux RND transporter periplasmic adaptor subunit [Gemmatimonadaceae bacterium]
MTRVKILAIATAAAVLAGGGWFYKRANAAEMPAYRFATLERGNLTASVSATGALSAVRTVQVGTQVSGQVSGIFVDFNDKVKKGELLATIDPTLQRQAVEDAQAGLERANAQLRLAQEEYDRNKQLFDAKIITAAEYGTVNANLSVAKSNVKSASIALQRARQNLAYTNIHSPIDGVIVERNVDVGQTVAASLSAPQLFLIANNLSQMQILASVDESDIGSIKDGQDVRFTVQSYPSRQFTGKVAQVRLQSTTTDNVVNYTVVVAVPNATGVLLPGMTATLQFTTGSAQDALTVSNAALRFRPTQEQLAEAGITLPTGSGRRDSTQRGATAATGRDSTQRAQWAAAGGQRSATRAAGTGSGSRGTLWYLDARGKLAFARVTSGLTDGSKTVVTSDKLTPGMQVIVGSTSATASTTSTSTSTNPLQPQRGPGGPPGGGRF